MIAGANAEHEFVIPFSQMNHESVVRYQRVGQYQRGIYLGCVKGVAKAYLRACFPDFLIAEHKVASLFANSVQRFKNSLFLTLRW